MQYMDTSVSLLSQGVVPCTGYGGGRSVGRGGGGRNFQRREWNEGGRGGRGGYNSYGGGGHARGRSQFGGGRGNRNDWGGGENRQYDNYNDRGYNNGREKNWGGGGGGRGYGGRNSRGGGDYQQQRHRGRGQGRSRGRYQGESSGPSFNTDDFELVELGTGADGRYDDYNDFSDDSSSFQKSRGADTAYGEDLGKDFQVLPGQEGEGGRGGEAGRGAEVLISSRQHNRQRGRVDDARDAGDGVARQDSGVGALRTPDRSSRKISTREQQTTRPASASAGGDMRRFSADSERGERGGGADAAEAGIFNGEQRAARRQGAEQPGFDGEVHSIAGGIGGTTIEVVDGSGGGDEAETRYQPRIGGASNSVDWGDNAVRGISNARRHNKDRGRGAAAGRATGSNESRGVRAERGGRGQDSGRQSWDDRGRFLTPSALDEDSNKSWPEKQPQRRQKLGDDFAFEGGEPSRQESPRVNAGERVGGDGNRSGDRYDNGSRDFESEDSRATFENPESDSRGRGGNASTVPGNNSDGGGGRRNEARNGANDSIFGDDFSTGRSAARSFTERSPGGRVEAPQRDSSSGWGEQQQQQRRGGRLGGDGVWRGGRDEKGRGTGRGYEGRSEGRGGRSVI